MADIEKVIKALECCRKHECAGKCPYCEVVSDGYICLQSFLMRDAIELLKEHEERIKTLESLRRIEQEGR